MKKRIVVTGSAGFIGFHAAKRLALSSDAVLGIDNFNSYYDVRLKEERAAELLSLGVETRRIDLNQKELLKEEICAFKPTHVLHLAAQAGVRYSLENPIAYVDSNLLGFVNVLEVMKELKEAVFVFASSSSVYGNQKKTPFAESDLTDYPSSLYGATKKANELIAYSYHQLYGIKATGLRFFTVYGPSGRPDMAPWIFTKAIFEGNPIPLFAEGELLRDFTYIDDIIDGTVSALEKAYPFEIFNLGNHQPVKVKEFVALLEKRIGKKALTTSLPMQPGDVPVTFADIEKSKQLLGFHPKISLKEGLSRFIDWWETRRPEQVFLQ